MCVCSCTDAIVLTCWHTWWCVAPDDGGADGGVLRPMTLASVVVLRPMSTVCLVVCCSRRRRHTWRWRRCVWWCVAPDDGGVPGGVLRPMTTACVVMCCRARGEVDRGGAATGCNAGQRLPQTAQEKEEAQLARH